MNDKQLLEVGYISRAHGLKGELAVRTYDPASDVLDVVGRILVRTRTHEERVLTLDLVRASPKELLVSTAEINTREGSEVLVGAKVLVFREDLEPPGEGEFFQGDLIGLTAVDEMGRTLGRVESLLEAGEVPNLVIRGEGTLEWLVPFAEEFVPTVDIVAGHIVVRPLLYDEGE